MKKSRILVPALAVLALGVAGSAVGTVAWFQASADYNMSVTPGTKNVTVIEDQLEDGDFKFIVAADASSYSVSLTDDDGKCYVMVGTQKVEVEASVPQVAIPFAVSVEYTPGDPDQKPSTSQEMQAIWAEFVANKLSSGLDIKAEQVGGSGEVKFVTSSTCEHKAENMVVNFGKTATLDGITFADNSGWKATGQIEGNFYIALDGELITDTAATFTVKLTPEAHTAA